MEIITVFSAKLYGSRNRKNKKIMSEPTLRELYNWGGLECTARMPTAKIEWKVLEDTNECYYIDRLFYSKMDLDKLKVLKQLTIASFEIVKKTTLFHLPPIADEIDPSLVLFFQRMVHRKNDELSVRFAKDNPYAKDLPAMQAEYDNWEREVRRSGEIPLLDPRSGPLNEKMEIESIQELNDSLDKDIAIREKNPKVLLQHFSYIPLFEKKLSRALTITGIALSFIALGFYCLYNLNPIIGVAVARLVKL